MSGFQVGVTALAGPAQRLKQIATDLGMAASGAATAAGNGGAAAGTATVSGAADVFKAGVQSVLATLGDDAGLLGDKVQKAGITYDVTDRTAMPDGGGSEGGPSPPAPDQPATSPDQPANPPDEPDQPADPPDQPDQPADPPDPTPPPPRDVQVARGDSLWSIATKRLGPDASNADVAAEVHRWYAANREEIGPNPDRLLSGTTLRAPDEAPAGG